MIARHADSLPKIDRAFFPVGYHCYYHDALKPGYSGTAIYSRHQPDRVQYGIGFDLMDREGRWLQVDVGELSVVSLYFPSGSSSEERQEVKFACMEWIDPCPIACAPDVFGVSDNHAANVPTGNYH